MASILVRTLIIYLLLTFILRLMGKRQIGELDIGDLVSTLIISELAAIPIDDPDIPLLNSIIPIILIFSLEILLSTLKNKSEKLKSALDGDSCFIIYKGRLLQRALRENRLSVNELMGAMRCSGVGDISEVDYAVLEQNGNISVLEKKKSSMSHAIIIDGELIERTASILRIGEGAIERELGRMKAQRDDVFLMTVDDSGNFNVILKEQENEG